MADVGNIGKFGKNSGVDLNTVKGGLKKEAMKTDEQKSIFDAVDADKNGVLDEKEVKAFKEKLDTSQDGVISKKEAKKFLKSLNLNEVDQKELLKFLLDYSLNTENVQDVRIKEENGQKLIEVVYKDGTTEVVHSDKSSEVTTLPDENGNVTTQFLTADKKLTKTSTTSANGDVTETEYAEDGETPVSSEITGKNGSVATISYEEGKPVSKQVKHGSTTSNYTYSEDGTEVLNSKIENEGVPTKERRIEYSYDENGVVTANITEQGKTTVQTIVDNKVQSETITEEGKTTVRTHNEDGTLTEEITTADGSETTVYNSENKKLSKTKVIDGEEYTIQYDGEGNTVGIIVQNGESPALIAKRFGCDVKDLLELNKSQLKGKGKSRYFNVAAEIKIPGEIEPDAKVLQGRQTKDEAVAAYKVTAEQIKAKKEAEAKAEADRIAAENKAKLDKENTALQKESAKQIYNDLMEAIDGINDDDDIYKALKQIDDPTEMAEVERLLQAKGYKADNYYSAVERFMQDELSDSKSYDKSFDEMEELVKTWISNGTLDGDKAINAQARLAARLIIDGCDGLGTDVEEAKEGVRLIKAPKLTGDPAVDNANAKKVYEQVENIIKKHKSFGAGFKGLKDYLEGDVTKAEIKYLDGILAQTNAIQGEEKAEAVKTLVKEAVSGGTNIDELKQALMAINSPEDRKNIEAQLKEYCEEKGIKPQIEGQDYLQAILYDECDTFFGVSTDHDEIRKFNEMMIEQGAYTEEEITKLRAETAALQMLDGGFDNIQQAATTIKDKTTFAKLDELLKTKNYSGVEGFVNKSFTSQVNRDKVFAQFAANNLLSSEKTIQVATRLLQNSDYDTRALGVMSIRNGQVASGVDKALKEKGKSLEQILTKFNEDKAIYQVKAKVWDGLAAFGFGHLAEHISDEYRENTDMSDNLYLESDTPIELSQSQIAAYEMTVKTLEDGLNQMKADYQSALDSQGVVSGAVNAFCSLYNLGTTRDEIEARIEHEEETVRLLKMAAQGKLSKLENGKTVSVSFEDVFNERQSKVVSANGVTTENLVNLVKPKDVKFDVAKVEKVANKAQTIVAMDYAKDNIAVCWSELDRGLKANSNKELSVAICDTLDKLSQMSGKEMNLSAFGYEVKDGVIVDKSGKPVPASDLKEIANQLKQGLSDVSSSLFGTTIPANSSYDDVVDLLEDGYEDKMDAFKQEYRDAFGQDATDEMIENYLSTINTGKMIVNVGAAIGAVIVAPFTGGGSLAVFAFGTAASMGLNALEKSTDADGYTRTEWTSDAEQALWDGALAAIGFKVGVGADKLATQGFKEGSKLAKLANDLMAKNKALIKKWAPNLSPEKAEQAAVWMSRTEAAFGEISSDTAQSVIQSYCMEGEFNSESFLTGMIMSVAGNAAGHTFSAIGDSKAIHQKYQKPEITVKESHHQTPTLDNITGGGNKPSGIKLGEEKAKSVNDEIDAMLANPETNEVDLAEAYGKLELIQNRDVRRQAQAKIMAAVENLSDADKATFGILNTNRLKGQVDDIMSSGRPLETADVRVINDYIKNETDPVALSRLKEQLKAARSSKQGVTATYEALDVAITKRVGQLDVAPEVINEPTPAVKPAEVEPEVINEPTPVVKPVEVEPEVNNPIDEDIPSPASDARIDTPHVEKPKLDSKAKISEFYNKQLDNIKSVYSSVKNSEIPAKFKKLWNSCGERLDSLTALISKGSFNKVKSLATGLISDLNQIISSVTGSIKNKINNILTDIQNWTKDIIDDVEVLRTPKTGKVSGGVDVGTSVQTRPVDMKLTRGERVEISSNAKLILANSVEVDLSNPDIQARINNLPEGKKLFIGRAGNIRIDDNFRDVSRFHVQLQKIDGKLYVIDDSLNGTRLLDNVPVDQSNVNVGGNGRKASSDYNSNSKLSAEDYEKVNTLRDIFHPEFNDPALIRAEYPKLAHYSDAELLDMFKLNEEHAAFIKNRKDLFDRRMPDGQRIYSERSYWTDSAYELINDHCAWKMHLFSDTTADYQQMADIVIPYLLEHNIAHKTLSTTISPELLTLTSTKQSGKAFTIYPQSQAEMEMIARDLEKLIRENNLARTDSNIIGDNQLGSSGRMFYRYEFPTGKLKDNIYKPGERAPYEGNRGPGQYLASDMSVADDPWHNFDPANPNSKPGVGSSAPSPVSARGSNPVVNDFSNVEVGTMLPKGQEVIVGADANFLLANRVEFNFSDPTIRAQLDAMKDGDVITVGRSGDIQIDDPSNRVSRKHLEIRKQGDVYVVTDHSKVGTEVAPKIAQNHEGILDFFSGKKSGNDVKAVMKKVTGPDGTPKYTKAQINELLELSQVPISDEVLTEFLEFPVTPELDFGTKKLVIQQLKTPDDVQVLSSLMNIAKSDTANVELNLAQIGVIIDVAKFEGKVSNPAEVFDKINILLRNGKLDLPETMEALLTVKDFLQSDEHKSFLMKLLDSFEQNDYRTSFWSYGDKLNSISAPLTIKNLNSLIEKYPDKFRPKYDDSGIIPEQTEAGITSIIHSVSHSDDVAGFQVVLMNDLCAQGASIDRIAEVLSSFKMVRDMDDVPNPQTVVELMNRGASGRIIELAIFGDLPASVLDNPALKYLEANNYKIDYENNNDVLTLLSADLSTPQQIQAFNNLLAAKDLGIQPVEITNIVSSIKTDADVAKLQAMIDSGKFDTFKFLQDIKPTTIDVDVPTTPEVKPVTPESAVQIRMDEIKRLNLTYGIDINHSSALVEMKINNPKRFAKIENSGLLDLIRDGKVDVSILERLEASPNMFISNRTLAEVRRMVNGEPLVKTLQQSDLSDISKHVANGDVCEVDGKLYANDNGTPVELKLSKDKFEELFPPLTNVAFRQGNVGDCWFVSTLENLLDKPAGRISVYQLFEQQGDDILVRFPGSPDAVLFNKGQLAYNGRGPAIQSADGSEFTSPLNSPKGVQMIEQAYAVHRLKEGARAYDANSNITDISKLTDTSALLKRMHAGTEQEAFCDLLGTPDVATTRNKTYFTKIIEESANDPNIVLEFGTREKPGFKFEAELDANYDLYSTHAYAIKGYNPETGMVYISNPWSTHTITEVPMYELTKHMDNMTVVDLRSVQRADVPEPVDVSALKNQIMELPVVSRYHGEYKEQLADKIAIAVMQGAENNPKLIAKRLEVVNLDKMSVLRSINENPENAAFVIDNYEAFAEIEDNLIGVFPRQIGQIFEATNAGNIDRIQALSRQVKAGNIDAINEINYIQFSAKPHEVIYGDTTVDVDSEVILSLLASRNHHNNFDFDTEIGKLFTSEVNMLKKRAYTKSLAGILEQKPELVDFVETTQNMTAPEYLAYVDKLIADGVIPEKMTFRTFAPDPNGVDAELAIGAYIHMKKANKYMDVDVSASAKTVSTEGQHEGILDIFKKKKPITTTSIVEKLSPEFQDLRARLLSSEMPTTFDKSYFESWAKENGLTLQYESNGTVAKFVDEDGLVLRRITEDSTKPGMVYDDRVSVFDEKGAQIGGKNTFSWDPRPLIFDVVDGHTANMVTLDASGNWVDKASGLRVNYNPITGMEAGMHGSVFGRIKDMFGGSSKQVDLSKNYDVSVSDAKIDYPNEGFVRSGQHQRALSSTAPSTVRNLDPSVNPRNIAQHVENGGVCSINGKLYANSNGNAVELKMSQETFERLFPEKGFATIKQRKGTNVCWLVSSLNSMATTVDGKIKIYSMLEELSDGSIKVQLAGPSKSFYIFPKGKALVAPEIQLGNGAAPGVEMIEQAVLANKINFPSGTSIDMDSCTNLVFAAGKMRTVSEAYELLGVSVKTCCSCQKSKSVDENIVKLHNFLKGRTWQDDVVTGTWNIHVRHITNYDPNTQMLTFHDPYFDGVDIQMPLDKFAATDPFIYSGTCGVSSRSQAKSHVVQQETPVQPSRPQRPESATSTRQSQIETTHSARAHVEQRAANIVSRNEWTKAGVDANGKEISVKQLSAGSVIVDRGGRKSVERFAEGQTRIELGKDANGVNLILTKSPDGDIRLSKLDPNGRASRLDNRANPEVKVETKTTSTTTSTSTSRVEDRTIKQRADVSVRPQVSKTPHFERRSTDLIGSWRDVATTADGLPISAKIKGDVVIIEKEGKFTEIPIAKGEEISVHETSTDSYLIIKREGYKTTITTSETPELDGAVQARPTTVETPAAQAQSGTTPSKPKFLQSGVETEIGTINGKPLKAKYESLSADRVATIKINGKIYNVGPGTSLDVADGITIENDKIGRVTFTNSQGADAPQVKPQERSSFADRFARRQEAQQPQDRGIGSFNPSRQPVSPSRPEVQATTEQPKTQTPSQNNGIGSFSSFSATRQVETPAVKPNETSAKPAETPVRPESKSQSNGISSFDTPRQDVQASSSNTGIGSFGDVKPAMDRPAPTRKVTEDEIYEEMHEIVARRRELQDEIDRTYDVKFKAIQTRQATLDVEFNEFNVQTRATIEQKRAQMNNLFEQINDEKKLLEILERQDRQLEQQFLEYKSALYDLEKKLELFEASHGRDGGSIGELYNYASEQRRRTIGAEFKDNMMEKVIPKNAPAYFYDPDIAELFHAYNITTGDNKARVVAELREKLAEITRKYEKNTANLNICRSNIETMEAQRSALSKDIVDLGEAQAKRRADYRAEKEALAGEVESTKAAKEQAEADVKNSPEVAKNSERYRELQRQLRGEIPMEEVPDEAAILAQQKEAQRAAEAQKSNSNGIGSFGGLGNTSTFSQRLNMSSRFGTVADVQPRRLPTPKTPVPSGYEVKGMMNYKGTECVYAKNSAGVTLVEVRGEWLRVRTL